MRLPLEQLRGMAGQTGLAMLLATVVAAAAAQDAGEGTEDGGKDICAGFETDVDGGLRISAPLPAPAEEPLLQIVNRPDQANDGDLVSLDMALLNCFGEMSFETRTIWTRGKVIFTGVPLARVFEAFDMREGEVAAHAVNNYSITFKAEDVLSGHGLIAYKRDGREMTLRNKGPLWIVYPYDEFPKYSAQYYYSRSIWQLLSLEYLGEAG